MKRMSRQSVYPICLRMWVAVVVLSFASDGWSTPHGKRPAAVLILHDSSGAFGWIGGLHSRMLANLIGHFDLRVQVSPIENYQAGDMSSARAVFYLGSTYNTPLPSAFKQDVLATTKPVCWFKYNLWQVGGAAFEARHGFRFDYLDQSGFHAVRYQGETLHKNQLDPELGSTTILNSALASVVSVACREDAVDCLPYIVRSGHFWYVADSPFGFIDEEDRYLIFADLLHDILGVDHLESHRAIIRLEDVNPTSSPEVLRKIADYLSAEEVPFLVSVIPVYRDPFGTYNNGVPKTVSVSQSPEFQETLRYMIGKGGQIVLHGYTHQYGEVPNPYSGASADDYEFLRVTFNSDGQIAEFQPVAEDSYQWAQSRVNGALRELRKAGLRAAAWATPHYAASPVDYQAFGTRFPLTIQRVLYFGETGNVSVKRGGWNRRSAPGTTSQMVSQFFPYTIQQDIYGQKVVPENLGNVNMTVVNGSPGSSLAGMIRIAGKNKVIRDGWASGFFHPYLDLALLQELVAGIKAEGYTFVPLKRNLR
jgi:uncharacterized protein YdaL